MSNAEALNERFGIPGAVAFGVGGHGALAVEVASLGGAASVACQGAQLLTWAPAGQPPVVWLSAAARFAPGKSLRGGAPVCWPWFGPHPADPSKPAHGFARNLDWTVVETARLADATRVVLGFVPGEAQCALWPHSAELSLAVSVGARLRLDLVTRNTGGEPVTLSQALHTYFHVGDVGSVRIEGLEGCEYVDRLRQDARLRQQGPVTIAGEVDRIYLGCPGDALIVDPGLGRRVRISKTGSRSYVVWNPWVEKAAKLGDLGEDGYRRMLCVETTNAWDDTVTVAPGQAFTLSTTYSVEPL
jgi:glucose-6-phosphate 1-epimerase